MRGHPTVDAEPPAVSRDLVKSRALSKKKRSEVADGTAESSRAQRIKDQLDQLDQLGQLDGSLNFTPIEFPDAVEHDVKTLLDIIAKTRGQVPLSDNFYNRLEDSTEEWLRRFTLDPYTTSPSHPALKYCAPSHPALKYYASTDSGAKTGEEEDGASEKDGEDDATSEKDGDGDDTSGRRCSRFTFGHMRQLPRRRGRDYKLSWSSILISPHPSGQSLIASRNTRMIRQFGDTTSVRPCRIWVPLGDTKAIWNGLSVNLVR
jgi:hypothetical protein